MQLRFDDRGLIPAVAQDAATGVVLMVAWMNAESLAATRASGLATFWSRSRGRLWQKGEESGNVLRVRALRADCDGDTLVMLVEAAGPACHTGRESCFFADVDADVHVDTVAVAVTVTETTDDRPLAPPVATLARLEQIIAARRQTTAEKSYTRSLLDAGMPKILAKIAEEADELAVELAAAAGNEQKIVHETADLLFHVLVGLAARNVSLAEVCAELARRSGTSGHAEKAARPPKP